MHVNSHIIVNKQQLISDIADLIRRISADIDVSYDIVHDQLPGPDFVLQLEAGGKEPARFVVEVCGDPRLARVLHAAEQARRFAERSGAFAAVALPRLGPKLRHALRERGVGYLSLDGQVYLRGGGVLIDQRLDHARRHQPAAAPSGNLFADKSSLVLRHLLSVRAAPLGIRDVAAQLGISPGLASRVVSRLKSEGYLVEENGLNRLVGRDALLADWAEFYRQRGKRQRERRFYLHARDVESVMHRLANAAWDDSHLPPWGLSFHAGASLVAPFAFFSEVHVLIDSVSNEAVDAFAHRLGLEPVRHEANVIVVHPYYQESWFFGLREIEGLPVVSDVQLYLDLSAYPRRGAEQAERIRERILALEHAEADS